VVDELIPGLMKLGEVQQVLQSLLREGVPIRQLGLILEALGDQAGHTHNTVILTEYVRSRLARTISTRYRDQERRLRVVTFGRDFEDQIATGVQHAEHGLTIHLSPQTVQEISAEIERATEPLLRGGVSRIVLVNPDIRAALKRMTAATLPHLVVLSYDEITPDTIVESIPAATHVLAPAA
jgi:flagellar biosynthesis protein FlhA